VNVARAPLTFRQRDVVAAIKAVERAGHTVARISIGKDGSIQIELAPPVANETAPDPEINLFDKVFDEDFKP
jgi:hypothetical protein